MSEENIKKVTEPGEDKKSPTTTFRYKGVRINAENAEQAREKFKKMNNE